MIKWLGTYCFLMLVLSVHAQVLYPRKLPLSIAIGDTISLVEKYQYNLLNNVGDGFEWAFFELNENRTIFLVLKLKNEPVQSNEVSEAYFMQQKHLASSLSVDDYFNFLAGSTQLIERKNELALCEFYLVDSSQIRGRLKTETQEYYLIETGLFTSKIYKSKVKSINCNVTGSSDDFIKPTRSLIMPQRYLFAPSALPARKAGVFYHNGLLFYNSFDVYFNKNVALHMAYFPFQNSALVMPMLRYGIVKNISTGLGFCYITRNNFEARLPYWVTTLGDEQRNLSLGMGTGYQNGVLLKRPLLTLAGNYKLSRATFVEFEFWQFTNNQELILETKEFYKVGFKWASRRTVTDAAFLIMDINNSYYPIPYLGITVKL